MNTNQMKFFAILALTVSGVSVAQAGNTVPADLASFEKMTPAEMKHLPDYKIPLNTPVKADLLVGKNETELTLLRNSIFAQVGFHFTTTYLNNYFNTRSWYKAKAAYTPNKLTAVDRANLAMIQSNGEQPVAQANKEDGRTVANAADDLDLAQRIIRLGYCWMDYGDEGRGIFVFGKNWKLAWRQSKPQASDSSSVYDSEYEGAYASSDQASVDKIPSDIEYGTWHVKNHIITYHLPHSVGTRTFVFTDKTWKTNQCSRIAI